MDYRYTGEQVQFRAEVRSFLLSVLPKDWMGVDQDLNNQDSHREEYELGRDMRNRLGAKGWLEISWPERYGGLDASLTDKMILEEEFYFLGVPGYDQPTFGVCGPLIMQHGTDEQKEELLLPIAKGKAKWAVGMSEPGAGSDFTALALRADEDQNGYLLNGTKTWQSGFHIADWAIVFARTEAKSGKNGMSAFLVDARAPRIRHRPIVFMSNVHAADEVYYDNVRVPKSSLLGEKNRGWEVATALFALDRCCGFQEILRGMRDFELLVEYCKSCIGGGRPLSADPMLRNKLAEVAIELQVGYDLGQKLVWKTVHGLSAITESCEMKVAGARALQHLSAVAMSVLGLHGQLGKDSKWTSLRGRVEHMYLCSPGWSIGGGTSEVSKNAIASISLGLPKSMLGSRK